MEREKIVSQGSLREFKNDGDDLDRHYLPLRGLISPAKHHLLPEKEEVVIYFKQLNIILKSLSIKPRDAIFIPDENYLLDLAIFEHVNLIKEKLTKEGSYRVYPYAVTDETLKWIKALRNQGFDISAAFPKKVYFENLTHPSHRGGWGRWISSPAIPSFPERYGLPYPVSWIGVGFDEIKEAYEKVVEQSGSFHAFFKPIFSAGGFTLSKISNFEELRNHYDRLKNQGALDFLEKEIPVEIQAFVENINELYSFQYNENGSLITPRNLSKQIVKDNKWQGNIFNGEESDETVIEIWKRFKKGYREICDNFGWGGIDLAKTTDGQWIILEHNGLRITGAHPPILLASQLGTLNQPFATLKPPGEVGCDLKTLWELLSFNNLAFNSQKKQGVFPIVWFPGSGMLWATGENPLKFLEDTYNILLKENYIQITN